MPMSTFHIVQQPVALAQLVCIVGITGCFGHVAFGQQVATDGFFPLKPTPDTTDDMGA